MAAKSSLDPDIENKIEEAINDTLAATDGLLALREKRVRRVQLTLRGLAKELGLEGDVEVFGSFMNGFKMGGSDLDVAFIPKGEPAHIHLEKFAERLPSLGFENITKIFRANVPLVKFTDKQTQMEVDFCINNELGVRNSKMLAVYCQYDTRVLKLGRLVKDWAKRHQLVGTADGYLNSYAYMLLVIHYLQSLEPPVVPNLQTLAPASASFPVCDKKWGFEDKWETKFVDDIQSLPNPTSENTMSVAELLVGFFKFYTEIHDWKRHAVCIRLNEPSVCIPKDSLVNQANTSTEWYIEDPFDLRHNLAGKCSPAGRALILQTMRDSLKELTDWNPSTSWERVFPQNQTMSYFLKCRISSNVTPHALLEEFEPFDLQNLYFPKSDGNSRFMQSAFLEFSDAKSRRKAHTKNETYIQDCQLQLHYSTQHNLREALEGQKFSTYEMASYKMQRQILNARVKQPEAPIQQVQLPPFQDMAQMQAMPVIVPDFFQQGMPQGMPLSPFMMQPFIPNMAQAAAMGMLPNQGPRNPWDVMPQSMPSSMANPQQDEPLPPAQAAQLGQLQQAQLAHAKAGAVLGMPDTDLRGIPREVAKSSKVVAKPAQAFLMGQVQYTHGPDAVTSKQTFMGGKPLAKAEDVFSTSSDATTTWLDVAVGQVATGDKPLLDEAQANQLRALKDIFTKNYGQASVRRKANKINLDVMVNYAGKSVLPEEAASQLRQIKPFFDQKARTPAASAF